MIVKKTENSILLENLTKKEMEFFEDKISFWEFLQENKTETESGE